MLSLAVAAIAMSSIPTPTPSQLAWHELEYYAFVHFGVNTFTDKEWGHGDESPALFAPTALSTDQWCRTFKEAGMKAVILTAKHHDGLCMWPTKFSDHHIGRTPLKEDLIARLRKSCDKFGLKLGLYLSPWDRFHPLYGTPQYNDAYAGQLEEISTKYGDLFEVWFDGANGEGPNGKRQVYDWPRFHEIVRRNHPRAVMFSDAGPDVRWVGNERGIASETNWNTVLSDRFEMATSRTDELGTGHADGETWRPAECDVSIRPGWFYHAHEDSKVKDLMALRELWYKSVGRGSTLLLNVPPDRRGLIADPDINALREFNVWRKETFAKAINISQSVPFNVLELREELKLGQAVRGFRVDAKVDNSWVEVAHGTTIGRKRLLEIPLTTASELRVHTVELEGRRARLLPIKAYRDRLGSN